MNIIRKDQVITEISRNTGFRPSVVRVILDDFCEVVSISLSNGASVQLTEFGTFEPKKRAARTGRNPHTNKPVPIPPRVVPVFKPGTKLKNIVTKEI